VTVDAFLAVLGADRPSASPLGLLVTGAAVVVMPALAWAKRRTAKRLNAHGHQGSAVLVNADAAETLMCAVLSAAVLFGVGANAVFGWWWADPLAGLVVVYFAIREGREAWEGESFDEA
jgi:divalent metal cation (Fe/Co/Zn/Cd) transporter